MFDAYDEDGDFVVETALASLLVSEVIFLNDFWWKKDWPQEAMMMPSLNVLCNDVFAWGSADADTMEYRDIQSVYDHYIKDPVWGTSVWCIKNRNMMPQKPVYDIIQKAGIWNLDEMNLNPNPMWPS